MKRIFALAITGAAGILALVAPAADAGVYAEACVHYQVNDEAGGDCVSASSDDLPEAPAAP